MSAAEQIAERFISPALPDITQTASGRIWALREASMRDALAIEQQAGVDPLIARALAARGVTAQNAADYLNPSLRQALPDPFVLQDMEQATLRIAEAIVKGEKIGVFGDYDVDGTTASAILKLYGRALGLDIPVYLPDRITEGYGPTVGALEALKEQGVQLVVTVDCGASAHEVLRKGAAMGLDQVVIDHHLMDGPAPAEAVATVNPNRPDDLSGLGNLCAAGLAFMLCVALNRQLRSVGFFDEQPEPNLLQLLDLAALGLVCDVMEMRGLTRVLVAQGLKVMKKGGNAGLKALGECAGVKGDPSSYHLGFLLGPRINAAGRIGHANLALDLLTASSDNERRVLAARLHEMNAARQAIEADVQAQAEAQIEQEGLDGDPVMVVAGDGWHPGVIGIVAGRLKEKYQRPVIVIGVDEQGGKGSGRSITGVDLGAAIVAAREEGLLTAGGGHAMAAGLSIAAGAVGAFRSFLAERLAQLVEEARAAASLKLDGVIDPSAVNAAMARAVEAAGPFGPGNAEPVFVLRDMHLVSARIVGKGHVSCVLSSPAGERVNAIAFRAAGEPLEEMMRADRRFHLAGKIRVDDWRGGGAGQFQIEDVAFSVSA